MLVPKTARARSPALLSTKVRSSGRDERHLVRLSERTLVSTLSISYGTINEAANADLGNACVCVGTADARVSECSTPNGDECQPLQCSDVVLTLQRGLLLRAVWSVVCGEGTCEGTAV